ncbi:plasma membrane calcium-transporting ATPase 4-like [Agrilus planipennis]|uniref:Calcium-transporting ATPase n=1 Tax=Agrilus planipennis TaxID=224129 RepID=A0A1W4WF90_AGRPL|nr:plasma membrane calcium-transporting ATPase 4-like [Agrilus planipennis]
MPSRLQEPIHRYELSPRELKYLMEFRGEEGVQKMKEMGGISEICKKLRTDSWDGIEGTPTELKSRQHAFGVNYIPPNKPKRFMTMFCESFKDVTIIILTVAATISLAISFYKPADNEHETSEYGWIEGAVILVSVFVVVLVASYNNYSKERQFQRLQNRIESLHNFAVVRNGDVCQISVKDIVVGDVCQIKYGDLLPADGIVLQANDLKVDESSLTGESDPVVKDLNHDPMLLAGTYVMEGSGKMLTVAVGAYTQNGEIILLLQADARSKQKWFKRTRRYESQAATKRAKLRERNATENNSHEGRAPQDEPSSSKTPSEEDMVIGTGRSVLQVKLTKLAILIGFIAIGIATLIILVLIIRFSIQTFAIEKKKWDSIYLKYYVDFFTIGITVLVVTLPEGLPLAVTIALAHSVKKMMDDNNLVRHLDACETMGNATVICTDKTGTLTTNRMTVVHSYINGRHYKRIPPKPSDLTANVIDLISKSISINTNYTSQIVPSVKPKELPKQEGNKTECALLDVVLALGESYDAIRDQYPEETFVKVYTFNSVRKSMSTIIETGPDRYRVYTKGASEIILERCGSIFDEKGRLKSLENKDHKFLLENVIEPMANDGLRILCVAYRELEGQQDWKDESSVLKQLTCLGIFGIEDPVRDEVPLAIKTCQNAGITVIMLTGDNINTARTIATKCGIITADDDYLVLEGKEFNKRIRKPNGTFSQDLFDETWPKLRVLARSSPVDKYTLVKGIIDSKVSEQREVVAVTGDGTNDAPALKMADVGFAMGISGTDVAKIASDIIITDDNFNSIVKAVMWGRNVYDSVSKFLQLQLTVNFVTVIVATIGAFKVAVPLVAVQLLWINLIMDTLASMALASDHPTMKLLERKPYGRTKALISTIMWRNIVGQGIYQLGVTLFLMFYGDKMLKIKSGFQAGIRKHPTKHFTIVFNTFVLMTLFNEVNARKVHGERNVFEGVHRNPTFCCIWIATLIGQVMIVHFGGHVLWTERLTFNQWLLCLAFGLGALPWAQLVASIPVERTD